MIARVVLAAVVLAAVFALGAAARALILAATRHGRHEQREQAAEAEADDFIAELRALPAPGHTIYTDHNVWLPHTPAPAPRPAVWWTPSRQPTEAELDEFKVRWKAAQGWLPAEAPPIVHCVGEEDYQPACDADVRADAGEAMLISHNPGRVTCPDCLRLEAGEPADVDAQVAEWQHILAPAERLATDTDVRASATCACGQPAGHLEDTLRTGSLDVIGHAFDTAQFPAVTSA